MKTTIFTLLVSMASFVILTSCGRSPVDKALRQIETSIEKLEKQDKMSLEDLDRLAKEMEEPVNVLQKAMDDNEVGGLTKMEIMVKLGKWAVLATSVGLQNVDLSNITKETEKNTIPTTE